MVVSVGPGMAPVTRHDPTETVGQVRVFAPTTRCRSYRLRWTEPDGTPGDTTAGTDPAAALAKATTLDRRLTRAAGPAALTPLGEIFTAYLADGSSPYTDRSWRASTQAQIEDNLGRSLRGHETVPALDLDRALCDRMRAQAGTPNMVRINTTALGRSCSGATGTPPASSPRSRSSTSPPGSSCPDPRLPGPPRPGAATELVGFVADVTLGVATVLRTAFANDEFGENIVENTSSSAARNNAVFAVDGDHYGFRDSGMGIRNGTVYRSDGARDGLAFYEDGHVELYDETATTAEALLAAGVWNTLSFGPALVREGEVVDGIDQIEIDTNFGNHSIQGEQPRTAVGVIGANYLVLVVVDGRDTG
jgi:hypothetical protein